MSEIHKKIAAASPKLTRGQVWCRTCGSTQTVDSARCLAEGWPKCCGFTNDDRPAGGVGKMSDEEKRSRARKAAAVADPVLLDRVRVDEARASLPRRIVVLPYGWVVVGFVKHFAGEVVIEQAATIRRWGTTKGLGELAREGPRENTKLDPCPTIRVLEDTVVFQIDVEEAAWVK